MASIEMCIYIPTRSQDPFCFKLVKLTDEYYELFAVKKKNIFL